MKPRKYLVKLQQASPEGRFSLARRYMRDEPHRFFAQLRAREPILVTDEAVLVATNADVREVLSLPTIFTVDLNKAKMGNHMLAFDETTLNARDKGILQAVLSRDDLPRIRELVGMFTDEALNATNGHLNLVPECTRKVPLRLVESYFGLSGIGIEAMASWSRIVQYDAFFNQPFDHLANATEVFQASRVAYQQLGGALVELAGRRAAELAADPSANDVVARLLKMQLPSELGFAGEALLTNIGGLLIGTVETASMITVHALHQLLARPDVLVDARKVAASEDHETFAGYVWEALRFQPFLPYLFRKSSCDHVLARGTRRETLIPAGSTVLPLIQSAMFDPTLTDHPEEFRPNRPYYVHSLHLGHGHHRCLGDQIARVMVPEIIRRLLLRPNLREEGPIDSGDGPFPEHYPIAFDLT